MASSPVEGARRRLAVGGVVAALFVASFICGLFVVGPAAKYAVGGPGGTDHARAFAAGLVYSPVRPAAGHALGNSKAMPAARSQGARMRAHRGSPMVMNAVELEEAGELGTTDYTMTFKSGGKVVSPWHDMPLELEGGLYNMLTEIPKMTLKKMEVDTKAPGNPIKQDEKKGKARLYHGPIFWNYGCLPQTWEDPNVKGDAEVGGAFGDDDPVDVVEIGAASLSMGSFTPVKALGVLSMIDDGELDWKVIAISAADEHADAINDVEDIEKFYPGTVSGIREWFRWYKTPDDKPVNGFGHGEKALGAAQAKEVIAETHGFYKKLLSGDTDAGKLWLREAA